MNIKNLTATTTELENLTPSVAFVCPACESEVDLDEIMEDGAGIKCVNCSNSTFGRST